IAVAVSSQNRCYYCLAAHGAAVRQYSGNPLLGEHLVMNYRVARLNKRHRAMLDFAVKLTASPWSVEQADRERLRRVGFTDRDIWDISAVAGFFNMSNRVASATDMRPNVDYHGHARQQLSQIRRSAIGATGSALARGRAEKTAMPQVLTIFLAFFFIVTASAQVAPVTRVPPIAPAQTIFARNGVVAAQEQRAARIGLEILDRGGNAIDAAVAVGFALAV